MRPWAPDSPSGAVDVAHCARAYSTSVPGVVHVAFVVRAVGRLSGRLAPADYGRLGRVIRFILRVGGNAGLIGGRRRDGWRQRPRRKPNGPHGGERKRRRKKNPAKMGWHFSLLSNADAGLVETSILNGSIRPARRRRTGRLSGRIMSFFSKPNAREKPIQ